MNQVLDNPHDDDSINPVNGGRRFLNPTAFAQPALGTQGTMVRNSIEGVGSKTLDLTLLRVFHPSSTQTIEIRAEAFNAMNWFQWLQPGQTSPLVAPNLALSSATFGQIPPPAIRGSCSLGLSMGSDVEGRNRLRGLARPEVVQAFRPARGRAAALKGCAAGTLAIVAVCAVIAIGGPMRAQQYPSDDEVNTVATGVDLSGEWTPVREEDNTGNTELGDWVGIPMNEAARLRAMAWAASIQTLPEWQCRPHAVSYISRGPSQLRISKEVDPVSRQVTAWHMEWLRSIDKAVYMDGRPHPSENAPHSWGGFSTGQWIGDMLRIETTHVKEELRSATACSTAIASR